MRSANEREAMTVWNTIALMFGRAASARAIFSRSVMVSSGAPRRLSMKLAARKAVIGQQVHHHHGKPGA